MNIYFGLVFLFIFYFYLIKSNSTSSLEEKVLGQSIINTKYRQNVELE